jgi:hypothetical protein
MSNQLDACLILGCGGYETHTGFLVCSSVSNVMLDLKDISEDNYEKTMVFLDRTCKMFDRPVYDYNKVVNIISLLYKNYHVIEEDRLIDIQRFIRLHKECGIFLILLLREDFNARQ